jgi:hypothetical protein
VLILGYYQLGDSTYVTSFFNVVRVHNTGAAFSFLASASGWQRWFFTGIGVVAALFILWMLRSHPGQRLFSFALACILGGAIGNVVDRLLHGYVVDFLDFHYGGLAFPGVQRGRQRHHHRRRLPDPGRTAAGAPRPNSCRKRRIVDASRNEASVESWRPSRCWSGAPTSSAPASCGCSAPTCATSSPAASATGSRRPRGMGVTALVQSSTATALIVSSFVGQGLVTLPLALAVMLGADVGTSLMAVVFSRDLSWLSPLFIFVGVVLFISRQTPPWAASAAS